ncbi:MAG: DNA replication/repair protein RecF [Parachlamydiaceae bacterium]
MQLISLGLANFRIYQNAFFQFGPAINGIIGDNAVGKTSLLEAIHVILFGRSFRTAELKDLIREGADHFRIELEFIKNGILQKICFVQGIKKRRILYNSTSFNQLSSLFGILHGVLIAPQDIDLIRGAPSVRRRFLDMQLSQIDPLYVYHLMRYYRALKQRNSLLKKGQAQWMDPFEQEMASSAAYLVQQRLICIKQLNTLSASFYHLISQKDEQLTIKYVGDRSLASEDRKELESFYLQEFKKLRVKELKLGFTLAGPQKNDCSFLINQKEVRGFASEGQKNSVIAALKLAEWELIAQRTSQQPLMLVDDLSLSLDAFRQHEFCKRLSLMGQCYFSATTKPSFLFESANWLMIKS